MFQEAPSATLIEVNYAAALGFVIEKMSLSQGPSKHWLTVLQAAACSKAGCEVQLLQGVSHIGKMTGVRCHTETKWLSHHAAFGRQAKLLFYETLSPYRSGIPSWLNEHSVTQRTLKGASFDPSKPALW